MAFNCEGNLLVAIPVEVGVLGKTVGRNVRQRRNAPDTVTRE